MPVASVAALSSSSYDAASPNSPKNAYTLLRLVRTNGRAVSPPVSRTRSRCRVERTVQAWSSQRYSAIQLANQSQRASSGGSTVSRGAAGRRQALPCSPPPPQPAPRLGSACRPLELGGDVLVEAGGRLGQMPGTPVGVNPRVGRLGQHSMHPPTLIRPRCAVHRRAPQRMAKPHSAIDFNQPAQHCQLDGRAADPEPLGRTEHQRGIAAWIGRCQQHEFLGVIRQDFESLLKTFLDST
jgi:hypothetical protein